METKIVSWIQKQPLWVKIQIVVMLVLASMEIRTIVENLMIESTSSIVILIARYFSAVIVGILWWRWTEVTNKLKNAQNN